MQIFLVYYGLSQFEGLRELGWLWTDVLSQPYWCAIITFSLHTAAYIAELFRGAIQAVPRGEVEAAQSLGVSAVSSTSILFCLEPLASSCQLMVMK